jgi:hypothetical protein
LEGYPENTIEFGDYKPEAVKVKGYNGVRFPLIMVLEVEVKYYTIKLLRLFKKYSELSIIRCQARELITSPDLP